MFYFNTNQTASLFDSSFIGRAPCQSLNRVTIQPSGNVLKFCVRCLRYAHTLRAQRLMLDTGHDSFLWILTFFEASEGLQRWLLCLSEFENDFIHLTKSQHLAANVLLRLLMGEVYSMISQRSQSCSSRLHRKRKKFGFHTHRCSTRRRHVLNPCFTRRHQKCSRSLRLKKTLQ